jgi:hypothetical protein
MEVTIWKLVRTLAGVEAGCYCRRCNEPIHPRDGFGMSESVCVRLAAGS